MNDLMQLGMDEFAKAFDAEMQGFPEGRPVRTGGKPTKANPGAENDLWWRQNGPAFVASWITWRQSNPNLHVLTMDDGQPAIELAVVAEVQAGEDSVDLKGYIDRVFVDASTGEVLIVDLKSGKTTPNSMQLGFYRRALKAAYGIDAQYGAYWMAREGTLSGIEDLSVYTDEVVDYWVATTYAGIKNNIFLPHISWACAGCGVKEHCYVYHKDARFSPIVTNTAHQEA